METEFRGLHLVADALGKTNLSERDIASHTAATSSDCEYVLKTALLGDASVVSGLRVLDVGAGASDFTQKLLELGADAYAVDPKYDSMSTLKHWVRKGNSFYKDNNLRDEYALLTRALERFKLSSAANRDRYKASFATNLPFPDNYFDIVYSGFTLFGYLDVDIDILTRATLECLRVTKPGGSVRLFPFEGSVLLEPNEEINELRMKNNQRLFKFLRQDERVEKVVAIVVPSLRSRSETLVIAKKGLPESATMEG